MARLVWDNVATPDFSPSMQGVRLFSDLIARAGQSATDTITGLDNRLADQQRMTLAQRMAGFQDADAYQAALQSGSVLDGLGRLKADDIMRADARLGTLIGREGDEARLDLTKGQLRSETWNQDKREERYNAQRAAAPALAEIQAAGGDQAKIAEIRAKYAPQLAALDFIDSREVANDANSYVTTAKGWRNSDQQYRISDYTQDRTEMTDKANDVGLEFASKYAGQSQAAMESDPAFQALDARGKVAAINALQAWKPADFGGVVSGITGSDAGNGGLSGDYGEMLVALESSGDPNARAGTSSATGLHQFTTDTWLNTVKQAGFDWARGKTDSQLLALRTNPQYSAQAERALRNANTSALQRANVPINNANLYAMHHFAPDQALRFARAGGSTRAEAMFSPAAIAANPYLAGKTKDEILQNWDTRSRGIPSVTQRRDMAALAGANQTNLGNTSPSDPMMGALVEAGKSKESQTAVLARLTGDNGLFKNANRRDIDRALTDIMTVGKVNAAAAAVILEFSGREENVGDVVRRVASNWGPVPLLGRRAQRQIAGNLALGDGRVADYGRVLARLGMANDPSKLAAAAIERSDADTLAAAVPQLNAQVSQWQAQRAAAVERQRATGVDQSREIARIDRLLQQAANSYGSLAGR